MDKKSRRAIYRLWYIALAVVMTFMLITSSDRGEALYRFIMSLFVSVVIFTGIESGIEKAERKKERK